jgi:EmrB/QacA subfamily drug resistance transporter
MQAPSSSRPLLLALIVACAMFMEQLDGTVVATALPAMALSLGTTAVRLNLAITAYMLSLAVFIPVSGWLADRFGTRPVFGTAIAVFTLGSALCGISVSPAMLSGARILQGIGGAMMVPVGRLVLLRSIEKSQMVQAMAWLMVPSLLGPVLGPPLGGFITTYFSWRWIFFLNLPIGIVGIALVSIFIPDVKEERAHPLDLPGFVLSGMSLAALVYGLDLLGRGPGDPAAWGLLAAGLVLGAAAIRHSLTHADPLLDLSLFRIPTFRISAVGGGLFRIGVGAMPFLLPLMLQIGFGMSAFASGLLTFGSAVGAMAMKASAGPILRRFGFRTVLIVNTLIGAGSILACALLDRSTPGWLLVVVLVVGGFFRSLQFTALNVIAYADVPQARMSGATSFYGMAQQVTLSAGVAVGALVLHLAMLVRGAGEGVPATHDFTVAFLLVGGASLVSVLFFRGLDPSAASEVSGHRPRLPRPRAVPAAGE